MASSSSSSSRRITQISSQFCQAGSHASQPAEDQLPLSVQISNRHVHLNPAAVEKLFGPGYTFALHHPLVGIPREVFESLPPLARKLLGLEYAAKETVDMVNRNNGKTLAKLRVLAPFRDFVQIEVRAPPLSPSPPSPPSPPPHSPLPPPPPPPPLLAAAAAAATLSR